MKLNFQMRNASQFEFSPTLAHTALSTPLQCIFQDDTVTLPEAVYSVIKEKKTKDCSANCDPSVTCDADIENLADAATKKCTVAPA